MSDESTEVRLARIEERQKAHGVSDDGIHGRMIGELGDVGKKLDNALDKLNDLDKRLDIFTETMRPIIEHYMAEHPSKVQIMPTFQKPASIPPYHIEAKRLGMLVGGVLVTLEAWAQIRGVIAGWLTHR